MSSTGDKSDPESSEGIAAELRCTRERLAELDAERRRLHARMADLGRRLADTAELRPSPPSHPRSSGLDPAAKVRIFRRLFRGREDVFPRLWISNKTGRKGYSPACSNEWKRGLCEKPRIRCNECDNRAFLPVTDEVALDHLRGKHVIDAYPMLQDDTTWFLAIDFDKDTWREDVLALQDTARDMGLAAYVERSRSGNGAHAWFFFAEPVPASIAREMGSHLLTETMSRRSLGLESYDRLFPNQDTLPKGGFGNLIALPLQWGPRRQGNTVFLDDSLEPHQDQWALLASVEPLACEHVRALVAEAREQERVLAVGTAGGLDDDARLPTMPDGALSRAEVPAEFGPQRVRVVRGSQVLVKKSGLSAAFLMQVRPALVRTSGVALASME